MIGTSRETVTRLFADLKKRQIVQAKGSTLVIRNKAALKAMASCRSAAARATAGSQDQRPRPAPVRVPPPGQNAVSIPLSVSQFLSPCEQGHEKR